MRIKITKTKNAENFYVIESTYINKKHSSKIVEKLGNLEEVKRKAGTMDPYLWAKQYASKLTQEDKENKRTIIKSYSQSKLIPKNAQTNYNVGYLFLQDIYYKLGLNQICNDIADKYQFKFDLNDILSKLIYSRILFPASKLKTLELSKKFLEQPNFDYQHIERALPILCKENDFIQSELYKNSKQYAPRNNRVLYYDCTNFFFEIEMEDEFRKYGKSKENRPNPIVQMGLFMDGDGIPLSCEITPGNQNEQTTLQPLEEKIIKDFELSKFVVCTDAGLASRENRIFNNIQNSSFIVTQSLKKIKGHLKDWALSKEGWHKINSNKLINLNDIDNSSFNEEIYYKERWINENNLSQRLIVSYSPKYAAYQKKIRTNQIERAQKLIDNPTSISKNRQNDPKRFIKSSSITNDGEIADKKVFSLNQSAIDKEAIFDGFYAVCTTLEDGVRDIIKINHRRWEIEESFRLMKSEFKSRPVYLSRDDRIKAHFTTCFLALLIYRILEHKLQDKYTSCEIIQTLRNMNLRELEGIGYIPAYTRTSLTDELHKIFGFRTDYEITTLKDMKKIFYSTKKK